MRKINNSFTIVFSAGPAAVSFPTVLAFRFFSSIIKLLKRKAAHCWDPFHRVTRCAGFTVMEMLIYMGLLSIFLGVVTSVFVSVLDLARETSATSAVEQDGRYILARLAYDVGRAQTITAPAAPGEQGNTLSLGTSAGTVTYALSGSDLTLSDTAGTSALNSVGSDITAISFTRLGNTNGKHSIRVALTLQSTTTRPTGPEVRQFQTTVGTR